jgi:SpoVK/Ycf46/Vps4 family AAA+-type ATPase
MLSRFARQIEVPLPGAAEREKIFNLYLSKCITGCTRKLKLNNVWQDVTLKLGADITPEVLQQAIAKTEGLPGRKIEQMVLEMQTECFMGDFVLNKELFLRVIDQMQ